MPSWDSFIDCFSVVRNETLLKTITTSCSICQKGTRIDYENNKKDCQIGHPSERVFFSSNKDKIFELPQCCKIGTNAYKIWTANAS